jgi:hypothetical protein
MGALLEFARHLDAARHYWIKLYLGSHQYYIADILESYCAEELAGNYKIEVIDIYRQPQIAEEAKIIATPTMIRSYPSPVKRLIGDFRDKEKVISFIKNGTT